VTRRTPLIIAGLLAVATLLPAAAEAQVRRAVPRTAVRATVVVGPRYYYRPYIYDPWDPWFYPYGYWYPPSYYGGYYDAGAALRLQVTPRQTEVFIDGYYAGVVDDFDGTFQRLRLTPGEHELQLFLPGTRPFTQRIYLQPGNTFRVRHTMEPLQPGDPQPVRPSSTGPVQGPPPGPARPPMRPQDRGPRGRAPIDREGPRDADYGTVAIRVRPADADVLIDGERWEGPSGDERLIVQLAPGPHRIEVRKDGYRGYTTEVTVRGGETSPLNVALAR
jgi:hypothetical protein